MSSSYFQCCDADDEEKLGWRSISREKENATEILLK